VQRGTHLGRQIQPHLPGGLRCRRGGAAPPTPRARAADRPRHGPGVPRAVRAARHACAGAADTVPSGCGQRARRSVLPDGAGRRSRLPKPAATGLRRDGGRAGGNRRRPDRHARAPARDRPRGGGPNGLRPRRRVHGTATPPLVQTVGKLQGHRLPGARLAARRASAYRARAGCGDDRPRGLPPGQHRPASDQARRDRGRA